MLCTNKSLNLIIKERCYPVVIGEKIRIPDFMSLSNHVSTETELNLKNQIVSVQGVADLISPFGIDFGTQQFLLPRNPIESKTFSNLPFSQSVLKAEDKDKF
ncbi:hypothetical protein CDAR_12401 [Caerostris darwini]|uniref:Uncharacterized protein n=1 Tax=Caerostris darwini TaxID=1538125 RepID=A0AAV4V1W5_9ARAC|nr:hypothetical protein CDAR_12401 [Caerostris darwini]